MNGYTSGAGSPGMAIQLLLLEHSIPCLLRRVSKLGQTWLRKRYIVRANTLH